MTSSSDTIMGSFVSVGGNQMPSVLADQLFCGATFLPDSVYRRHLDLVKGTKRPIPFATIRSSHYTAGWEEPPGIATEFQRAQSSVSRALQQDAYAREATDKLSQGLIDQFSDEDTAQRAKLEAASDARSIWLSAPKSGPRQRTSGAAAPTPTVPIPPAVPTSSTSKANAASSISVKASISGSGHYSAADGGSSQPVGASRHVRTPDKTFNHMTGCMLSIETSL